MTMSRRLICLAVALCMILTLIPSATGTLSAARADSKQYGITLKGPVHTRYAPEDKIAFDLPADFVAEIRDTKVVNKVKWYKIATIDPERKNNDIHIVYIHGDFFRQLTDEEYAQYQSSGTVATPTPVPDNSGDNPTPTPTPAPSGKNEDLPAIEGSIGSVTAGGTNLREGPGTGYHSITRLDRNTQVELLTIPSIRGNGTFFKVRYNGQVGYIMSDFVSIISGGPASGNSVVVTATPTYATGLITPTPAPSGDVLGYVRTTKGGCNLRATISGTVI